MKISLIANMKFWLFLGILFCVPTFVAIIATFLGVEIPIESFRGALFLVFPAGLCILAVIILATANFIKIRLGLDLSSVKLWWRAGMFFLLIAPIALILHYGGVVVIDNVFSLSLSIAILAGVCFLIMLIIKFVNKAEGITVNDVKILFRIKEFMTNVKPWRELGITFLGIGLFILITHLLGFKISENIFRSVSVFTILSGVCFLGMLIPKLVNKTDH